MTTTLPPTDNQPTQTGPRASTQRRWLIVLGVLMPVVLIAATAAVVYYARRGPANPIGSPSATAQPSTAQPSSPSATTGTVTPQEGAEMTATARSFVTEVVGLVDPVASPVRLRDDGTAAVDFRVIGPNGQPVGGAATTVLFTRSGGRWLEGATVCDDIRVETPSSGQLVSTPLAVAGQASVIEGTVIVRLLAAAGGKLVEEGRGVVTGAGRGALAPFMGQITFRQPNGGVGYLVFYEESPANGQVLRATVVNVTFPVRS